MLGIGAFVALTLGQFSAPRPPSVVVATTEAVTREPLQLEVSGEALPTPTVVAAVPVSINGIERVHVRVNDTPVVSLPPAQVERAIAIADRIAAAQPEPEDINLDQINELPVATVDNAVLFTVDHLTASEYDRTMPELAVSWTNNLRLALGGDPLPASEIQAFLAEFEPAFIASPATQTVWASWYGPYFEGRPTASGEIFRRDHMTAAHRYLPLGTRVRVTNPQTGESIVLRINDRGPFIGNRALDLSEGAARELGVLEQGVAQVQMQIEPDRI